MASSSTERPTIISEDMKKEVGLTAVEGETAPEMKSIIDKKINAAEALTKVQQKLDAREPLTEIEANHAESVEHKALGHRPRADSLAAQAKSYVAKQDALGQATDHKNDTKEPTTKDGFDQKDEVSDQASKNVTDHMAGSEDKASTTVTCYAATSEGDPAVALDYATKNDSSSKTPTEKGLEESSQKGSQEDGDIVKEGTEQGQAYVAAKHENDAEAARENEDPASKTGTICEKPYQDAKLDNKSKADGDVDSIQKYHADMVKSTAQKVMDTNTDV